MLRLHLFSFLLASLSTCQEQPLVETPLGVLGGLHLPQFDQDAFLGVPFALPPTNQLRFARPYPYNVSWTGVKDVTSYGHSCYGFGSFSDGLPLDEDCLFLNIIKPAASSGVYESDSRSRLKDKVSEGLQYAGLGSLLGSGGVAQQLLGATSSQRSLPVFVWIHGGGFIGGGAADQRYNLSYIVNKSVEIGKPMIGISINYRMLGFGFMSGGDVPSTDFNAALKDQRLALEWIHDNIALFGGDPDQVTIAGESAGGWSVGFQLVAHGGNNKGLFRSAILQSGTMYGKKISSNEFHTRRYNELAEAVGCGNAANKLDCLRQISPEKLMDVFISTLSQFFWDPVIDNDFLPKAPWELMQNEEFAKVDILIGTNMDECTCPTHGPRDRFFDNTEDLRDFLIHGSSKDPGYRVLSPMLTPEQADRVLAAYPDDPSQGCPFKTGATRFEEHGLQYKRGAAMIGDWLMQAGRRHVAQQYASVGKKVYSYHFEQEPWRGVESGVVEEFPVGVAHFTDVAYIFNIPDPELVNWYGVDIGHVELAELMSRMWISFVSTQDPNGHGVGTHEVKWPRYREIGGENIIFKGNGTRIEQDDFRKQGMQFWAETWKDTTRSLEG